MRKASKTELTRKRYDRVAFLYDLFETPMERFRFANWRKNLLNRITGKKVLEVGVGTGKNLPYYPPDVEMTAIDLSPQMLDRARKRASALGVNVFFREMDAQKLSFPNHSFDTVFTTFVFRSIPDPVAGLKELRSKRRPMISKSQCSLIYNDSACLYESR